MKESTKIIIYLTLAVIVTLFPFFDVSASILNEKRAELDLIKNEKSIYQEEVDKYMKEATSIEGRLDSINAKINKVNERIKDTEIKIDKTRLKINELNDQIASQKNELANQKEILDQAIMYVYEEGETPFIETLFSSDTFSQILDRTEYLNTTQLKVEKTMGEIETIKQKLQDKRVEQKEKRREQKRLKNDLNLQYKELANDKAEKSSLLNETKAKQSDFQQKVDRLSAEAKKVESEMERLERLSRSGNSGRLNNCPAGPNYRFSFPSSGGITCDYYCYSGHTGTDFGAGYDGYARASAPGKVVESNFYYPNLSNPDWGYGNYVRIEHSGGWYTLYAHLLKNRYVSEGQYVSRGQVIGEIGYVGNVIPLGLAGTHLHFEIRKSYWQPVNPECYLY